MSKRFVALWFPHLITDRHIRRQPALMHLPFVTAAPERGRMVVTAANKIAESAGIGVGMVVADSRAILPALQVLEDEPQLGECLLKAIAEWCLRYTPVAAVDPPAGLILDVSGCAHLWGGEAPYLRDILMKLRTIGYDVRGATADTIGTAWAVARFAPGPVHIVDFEQQADALMPLPPAALRLGTDILDRMEKLGLRQISSFIQMPRSALRRRFGPLLLLRLDQAIGSAAEAIEPVVPVCPYIERLPAPEPIRTATGIEIALRKVLEVLCGRLSKEGAGLRTAVFKGYRTDGNIQQITIGTSRPSRNVEHLFRLFELRIATMEPVLGFELFLLEAPIVEALSPEQETLWNGPGSSDDADLAELLDRLAGKVGINTIHRYLPEEHYWPERSIKQASSLQEAPLTAWRTDRRRPVHLLPKPEPIEVTVAIPDYPPMLFRYKGKLYNVNKADGPERIEREWWLENGQHRDYYCVEDEAGARYWIFRLGHYADDEPGWFIHGFFA